MKNDIFAGSLDISAKMKKEGLHKA